MKVFANFRSAESDPTFSTLKEKYKDKPITFLYDYPPKDITELSINPINIIMVHEPDEFFGIHSWVKTNHELYSAILTWNKDILDNCSNAYPFTCNYQQDIPQVFGKRVCYEEPMFHICIENVKHDNWYTEKIGEAFCTKTVPIYWGCPNIGEYYDKRGIITFDSPEELPYIINNLTPEKYLEMKPYIDHNYKVALEDSFPNKLNEFFAQLVEINNL